ncbi:MULTISPECIES: hypothetical protein [unclassified Sphingobium]|uniref:hypothetical protein n=1 Tax=unclassified Sphingobium TaxID=2611147 RepID=UPI001A2A3D92|nr:MULTISPECIES: hypothetical protein [unclassified Sphingobium]MBG6120244.1 hypothetical protein [Sphingobium sp. JAI105]
MQLETLDAFVAQNAEAGAACARHCLWRGGDGDNFAPADGIAVAIRIENAAVIADQSAKARAAQIEQACGVRGRRAGNIVETVDHWRDNWSIARRTENASDHLTRNAAQRGEQLRVG